MVCVHELICPDKEFSTLPKFEFLKLIRIMNEYFLQHWENAKIYSKMLKMSFIIVGTACFLPIREIITKQKPTSIFTYSLALWYG